MSEPTRPLPGAVSTPEPGRTPAAETPAVDPTNRTVVTPPLRLAVPERITRLLLLNGPDPALVGRVFQLERPEIVVGRGEDAGLRLEDPGVSRSHVRLTRDPTGQVVAEDLGSTNGTFLNGASIKKAVLVEGDRLQIGTSSEILFGMRQEDAQAEVQLRRAVSAAGAGTWEWLRDADELRLRGGVLGTTAGPVEPTEPRADGWNRIHPDDLEALRIQFKRAIETAGRVKHEVRLTRSGGEVTWVAFTGEPFPGEAGRVVRLAGAFLDVTERRRAEAEVRRLSLLLQGLGGAAAADGPDGTIID